MKHLLPTMLVCCSFCLSATCLQATPPYKGAGGQLEAVGMIAGTYLGTARYVEICQNYPDVKTRALTSYREYLERNHQTYMDVMKKLPHIAATNGGRDEVQRLEAELKQVFKILEDRATEEGEEYAKSAHWRVGFLDKVDKGLLDLKLKNSLELSKILD